ncbi:hypothetical protein AVEN_25692-1 [Araneus ventricosus]|uniref:Lipase domain-containing protein n=1 Tax=Araneus ventricosus TaxID=182803 RepID=A0A4Y2QI62_ARAVE|nr:hypothetical protein AVEN_25692-1 [Araneus ventricosus]
MLFSEAEPLSLDASVITLADQYLKKSFKDIVDEASSPPMNKNSSIQYLLFTPDHPDTPCYLESNMEALKRCPFNPTYPIKIVIHGFIVTLPLGNLFFKIKDNMLELYKYNVIILDWTRYNQPPYIQAAVNNLKIGYELATLIRFLGGFGARGLNRSDSIPVIFAPFLVNYVTVKITPDWFEFLLLTIFRPIVCNYKEYYKAHITRTATVLYSREHEYNATQQKKFVTRDAPRHPVRQDFVHRCAIHGEIRHRQSHTQLVEFPLLTIFRPHRGQL